RTMQLLPGLSVASRQDERIDGHVTRFVVRLELESFREQRPQHQLAPAGLAGLFGSEKIARLVALFCLGDNVEMVAGQPARSSDDLEILKLIRISDQHSERHIRGHESAAGLNL